MATGSERHHIVIDAPADDVFIFVGRSPGYLALWDASVKSCSYDPETSSREVTFLSTAEPLVHEILVNDRERRRFQHRALSEMLSFHRETVDVIELDERTSLVVLAIDTEPAEQAAAFAQTVPTSLDELKALVEDLDRHALAFYRGEAPAT
ncbi:MAG: hypothetical protein GY926_18505 [bacterium]|nr:hypothetical protein [bacterium]